MLLIAIGHSPGSLQSSPEYRTSLKEHITILLGTTKSPELEDVALTNAATQVVKDMNKALKDQGSSELTEDSKRSITSEMTDLRNPDGRIRQILRKFWIKFSWFRCLIVILAHRWSSHGFLEAGDQSRSGPPNANTKRPFTFQE